LEESFHGNEDITEVYLPDSMRVIGPIAFAECPNLRKIVLNEGLEEIGDGAFLGALGVTEIALPASLKRIGPMAFYACGLREISIPESVEFIGENCFWECPELAKASVLNPDCIIEEDAFGECPQLTEGYMAPGFPRDDLPTSNLIFSMLWLTSFDRHAEAEVLVKEEERRDFASMHIYMDEERGSQTVAERAQIFIRKNQNLVLENILRANNTAAMRGIIEFQLFDADIIEEGLKASIAAGLTELSSLFLTAKATEQCSADTDCFEL